MTRDPELHVFAQQMAAMVRVVPQSCRPACRDMEVIRAELRVLLGDYAEKAWVAGGFAAAPEKATDVDIFMVGMVGIRDETPALVTRLERFGCLHDYSYGMSVGQLPSGMPIQVIMSAHPDIRSCLDNFDIREQAQAWHVASMEQRVTGPLDPGHITLNWETVGPKPTLPRAVKIATRYYKRIRPDDMRRLLEEAPGQFPVEGL